MPLARIADVGGHFLLKVAAEAWKGLVRGRFLRQPRLNLTTSSFSTVLPSNQPSALFYLCSYIL